MNVVVAVATVVGMACGGFASVVVARVPQGRSVVQPSSACPHCKHPIRFRHMIPVLGWLMLGGRCFDCGAPIGVRYLLLEVLMGVAFGVLAAWLGPSADLGLALILAFFGVVLSAVDVQLRRLPDAIVGPFAALVLAYLVVWAAASDDWTRLMWAGIGALTLGGGYFALWWVYPRGMGFGDVKLSPVLGAILGWVGVAALIVGGFAAFVWGSFAGIVTMLVSRQRRTRTIAFGPWMFAGAWTGIVAGNAMGAAYLTVIGL